MTAYVEHQEETAIVALTTTTVSFGFPAENLTSPAKETQNAGSNDDHHSR